MSKINNIGSRIIKRYLIAFFSIFCAFLCLIINIDLKADIQIENSEIIKSEKKEYNGKVVSILSASMSTFAGYIPVEDGHNLAHRARYPQDNLLTNVNETWWMRLINDFEMKLGINDSWAGSTVINTLDYNTGDIGVDAAMASITRIENLGSNGTPDLIIFYGGGNDLGKNYTIGTFDEAKVTNEVDLTSYKWDCTVDAYICAIKRIKYYYPNAKLVCLGALPTKSYYSETRRITFNNEIEKICEYFNIPVFQMDNCGVELSHLPDGIHMNADGMKLFTEYLEEQLLHNVSMTEGENKVYSIKYNLENVTSDKSYYKGVSADSTYEDVLSTTELKEITITMDNIDITDTCYSDGNIFIDKVTGDVVITAKAKFKYNSHVSEIPLGTSKYTNLLDVIEAEKCYFYQGQWTDNGGAGSITIPVETGDQIYSVSFKKSPDNGRTSNGTRVTYFNENGLVKSLDPSTVYKEYSEYGYLTIPDNVCYVNISFIYEYDKNEIYLLTLPSYNYKWRKKAKFLLKKVFN